MLNRYNSTVNFSILLKCWTCVYLWVYRGRSIIKIHLPYYTPRWVPKFYILKSLL